MRTWPVLTLIIAGLSIGCGAEPTEEGAPPAQEINKEETAAGESRLVLSRVSDTEVAGSFSTPEGAVSFSSVLVSDDLVDVKLDIGGRVLGSHVDWAKLENNLSISDRSEVTATDRSILTALTIALETELGKATKVSDNLARQAALWGAHPEGELSISLIVADQARSWTTLCNGTSYRNFAHDTGSHALQSEYLKYGPGETTNPCRARCGPGCYAVGTSAWTVDCGEHDRCEQLHGSGCGDEFNSASDDYTFAGNCSY